jgi:kinetochore protein Mis13/DSN1
MVRDSGAWDFGQRTNTDTYFLALPHSEVEVADFYKHIESEGLTEPRRMRQLLTWCATRALSEQPRGSPHAQPEYEDQSARLAGERKFESLLLQCADTWAARVIQEELLRDFANRSEMSDWFGREEEAKPEESLPVRPNPKNEHNTKKIEELEAQIKR